MSEAMSALGFAASATAANASSPNESDYESDGSESTPALAMRRREASDDDEDEEEEEEEADGDGWLQDESDEFDRRRPRNKETEETDTELGHKDPVANGEAAADEKKEAEPFMVPTSGAFYMHDDRFKDSGGARPRRGAGGRRLWEARDEKPWIHDMFEELNVAESDEGYRRRGRGQSRGRGRGRDRGRGGGRIGSKQDDNVVRSQHVSGRGRATSKEARQNDDKTSLTNRREQNSHSLGKKQAAASSLSSTSPPFFPSGVVASQKLTAHSTSYVPKPRKDSSSNSLYSEKFQISTKHGSKPAGAQFYAKTLNSALGASKGKQVQSKGRTIEQPAEAQQTQDAQTSSTSSTRASRAVSSSAATEKSSFMYSGSATAKESSFSAPQIHPIVPQGSQSQGALVVPSMGMSVQPMYGYGYGSSEITWVPVLAGGGSGIGGGFMSPYIAMDGTSSGIYYPQGSSQRVYNPSGRDLSSTNPSSGLWKPPSDTADLVSEERQNKSRRSSEMNFGQ